MINVTRQQLGAIQSRVSATGAILRANERKRKMDPQLQRLHEKINVLELERTKLESEWHQLISVCREFGFDPKCINPSPATIRLWIKCRLTEHKDYEEVFLKRDEV